HFCSKGVNLAKLDQHMEHYKGRDLVVAGMVTEAFEGMAKNGSMYANLTLTDYEGSLKFFFYRQQYIDFGKYCKKGLFLMIRGKVGTRYQTRENAQEQYEFKISQVELLQEVRQNKVKKISLDVSLYAITEQFVAELNQHCQHNKGNTQLEFNVFDPETKISIHLFSRNIRVNPSDEFIDYLRSKEGILFKIN
ncbi:MAG: hypothetical protein JXR22_06595, partial [Prolixibacteraceae bacterium]|nr:hypothetical protein [Prolixibacteraceae bacterium]